MAAQTKTPPSINIPDSSNTCEVYIIDTTSDILVESWSLFEPEIKGHKFLNLPTFAFLIHNISSNKWILFDLGTRKDWWNLPPAVIQSIESKGIPGLRVKDGVDDILIASGFDLTKIDAVVWSHFHWDHIGNIQKFPTSTDIVVGPGFRSTFLPSYPTNPNSPFYDDDFKGRHLNEISFDSPQSLRIGNFPAFNYFGDHSFYLLDTPGHAPGHISALVRTTPDTFIFLGGDICHFPGAYRPSPFTPMPEILPLETKLDSRLPTPCPCSLFLACHPEGPENGRATPFYRPSSNPESWYLDAPGAQRSINSLAEFDADERVFITIAHDPALREICEVYPHASMNDWKEKGWKQKSHWNFVNELPLDGRPGRPKLVESRIKG
ncbi:hypothetical protein ACJZ2D_010307 [Fusarium nematophilum]